MISGAEIFWGGVLPAVVAAAVLFVVWRLTGKAASAWRTALVAGYLAGHWALSTSNIGIVATLVKSYQPTEAHDWIPLLIALAMVPDAIACLGKRGPALAWLLRAALCLFAPWRFFQGSAYLPLVALPDFGFETLEWSTTEAATQIGAIGAMLLFAWFALRVAKEPDGLRTRSALAVVVALGAAITVALSGSLLYGQLLGVLTAALAGTGLASAIVGTQRDPEAAAGPLVLAYGGLLLLANFYAELTTLHTALLLVAMLTAIGWLPRAKKLSPRAHAIIRTLLCLAALGTAVSLAAIDFAATQNATNPYSQAIHPPPSVRSPS